MPLITQSEQGSTGYFINMGSPAQLDDLGAQTAIAYCSLAAAPGILGYIFGKSTAASFNRLAVSTAAQVHVGRDSTGLPNSPDKVSVASAVNITGIAQHIQFDFDGTINSAGINNYVDAGSALTAASQNNGSGALNSDAAGDFFLMNRAGLGREFVGKLFYLAVWNRILTAGERVTVRATGPLDVPSGLVLCYANGQDYSTFAHPVVGRSTLVNGGVPPNTALGGSSAVSLTCNVTGEDALIAASLSVAGSTNITANITAADAVISASLQVSTGGTITSQPLKDNTGIVQALKTLNYVCVYNVSTGDLVVRLTGLSTNASGVFVATHASIVPGTSYRVDWETVDNKRRMPIGLAA